MPETTDCIMTPSSHLPTSSFFARLVSPANRLHQTAVSLADQGIASAANFLTGVIIARSCSKSELGLYMLGVSLVLFITDLQTSLIATPYMVYAPRLSGEEHARYTGSTLLHQFGFSLFVTLGLACCAVIVSKRAALGGLGAVLWVLSLLSACITLREFARRVCFAQLKIKVALLIDTCIAVTQVGMLILLSRNGLLSAQRAYWVIGSVCAPAVIWWLWYERNSCTPRVSESVADFKKNWAFGKWVFASGAVWTVSTNLYPWILAFFHGSASVGVWAACLGVVALGNPALLGVQNLVGPIVSHVYAADGHRALHRLTVKIAMWIAFAVSILSGALCIAGGKLVASLYGSHYAGNGVVVAILALNLLVSATVFPFSRALFAIDQANFDFYANCTALFIMATLGLWLVWVFGPLGAALGLLGASIVASVIRVGAFLWIPSNTFDFQAAR